MTPFVASTVRRSALWVSGLAATLTGHVASGADAHVLPVAPAAWIGLFSVSLILGAFRPQPVFTHWSAWRLLGTMLAVQAVLHVALHGAPWAFGLVSHGHTPLITTGAVVAHIAVAVLLLGPLCLGQRTLERAVRIARAVMRHLAPRGRAARPGRVLCIDPSTPPRAAAQRPRSARGPPAGRTRPAITPAAAAA